MSGITGSVAVAALGAIISSASFPAAAGGYSFTTFDVPGSTSTDARGINDAGAIVGDFNGAGEALVRNPDGTFTTFSVPGATNSLRAYGINNTNVIAGSYGDAAGSHGFVRSADGNTITKFDVAGGIVGSTVALGINDNGQSVGFFTTGSGTHGFLRSADGTAFTTLDAPGATTFTEAWGVNDGGMIVGLFNDATGVHGFVRDAGGTFGGCPDHC